MTTADVFGHVRVHGNSYLGTYHWKSVPMDAATANIFSYICDSSSTHGKYILQ
jgi:hypothetical protein